jgi:hypothetical protein
LQRREIERERETERQRDRETERQRQTEREKEKPRKIELTHNQVLGEFIFCIFTRIIEGNNLDL